MMQSEAQKKSREHKKHNVKSQEKFAKNFPYRFSWLTEPKTESLQPWKVKNKSLKDQLPLQKKLVPTRSIPIPGLGTPDFTSPTCSHLPPLLPTRCNPWELKLLSHRFPRQFAREPFLPTLMLTTSRPMR
ncbi:uncharacterized protein C3orf22 homolog [Cavia porcellus]|uniref:uncharacterized protein C3orf22 homolog n=1 Tax=Cavia porcellus TaxID=10141 RepID=UPI002FDF8E4C